MSIENLRWLVGLLLTQIGVTLSLISLILNDKLRNPLRVAIPVHAIMAVIEAMVAYQIMGTFLASGLTASVAIFFLVIILSVLKQRDVKGISLGENFIEFERIVDYQTSYVLGLVEKNLYSQIKNAIQQALKYILDVLSEYLGLDNNQHHKTNTDHSLIILLTKNNGKFKVLAQNGITPIQIQTIESQFRYKPNIVSVAGYAASRGISVCIPDISVQDKPDDPVNYWIKSDDGEKQEGFLLCYPILRGMGRNSSKPLAVICLASHTKQAYDQDSAITILERIAPKIENLLIIYQKFAQPEPEDK